MRWAWRSIVILSAMAAGALGGFYSRGLTYRGIEPSGRYAFVDELSDARMGVLSARGIWA